MGADTAGKCVLIPGVYGIVVQCCLGFVAFAVVITKHLFFEEPRRLRLIFVRDLTKLAVGGLWVHLLNMSIAELFSTSLEARGSLGNADVCDWYLLNVTLDATVGLLLNHAMLLLSESLLQYRSGYYGPHTMQAVGIPEENQEALSYHPYRSFERERIKYSWKLLRIVFYREWFLQTAVWISILTVMKALTAAFVCATHSLLPGALHALLGSLDTHPKLKLVAVMIVFPMGLSIFQYLIMDNFLRCDPELAVRWNSSPTVNGGGYARTLSAKFIDYVPMAGRSRNFQASPAANIIDNEDGSRSPFLQSSAAEFPQIAKES